MSSLQESLNPSIGHTEKTGDSEYPGTLNGELHDRESKNFDPFDNRSAYTRERSKTNKMFGKLQDFSIRTGAMGLISAILGTGVLALPNGIAHYGWATSLVALTISAIFQVICYYLFAHVQSMVRFYWHR
jgi:hypothetical protein